MNMKIAEVQDILDVAAVLAQHGTVPQSELIAALVDWKNSDAAESMFNANQDEPVRGFSGEPARGFGGNVVTVTTGPAPAKPSKAKAAKTFEPTPDPSESSDSDDPGF